MVVVVIVRWVAIISTQRRQGNRIYLPFLLLLLLLVMMILVVVVRLNLKCQSRSLLVPSAI